MLATRSPEGIDVTTVAVRFGLSGSFYIDPPAAAGLKLNSAGEMHALVGAFVEGVDKALAGAAAGREWFDFKYFHKRNPGSKKLSPTKVRATLYMNNEGFPWVHLSLPPSR